jgi:hypothetical protein
MKPSRWMTHPRRIRATSRRFVLRFGILASSCRGNGSFDPWADFLIHVWRQHECWYPMDQATFTWWLWKQKPIKIVTSQKHTGTGQFLRVQRPQVVDDSQLDTWVWKNKKWLSLKKYKLAQFLRFSGCIGIQILEGLHDNVTKTWT